MLNKLTFILISFLIILNSCKNRELKDLDFPDKIQTTMSEKLTRIQGTKVFALIPEDYFHSLELARYQKDTSTYFQTFENTTSSFTEVKPVFTKEYIEAQGATIDLIKDVTINQYEGIYGVGPSKYPGESKFMLIFGDDSFMVMITAVCKTNDLPSGIELINIFQSIYYDKSFQLNDLELANFIFDESITGFSHSQTISNFFIYSPQNENINDSTNAPFIQLSSMPFMDDSKANEYTNDLLLRFETNGIFLQNKEIIKTQIGDYTAFGLETLTTQEEIQGILYLKLLLGDESSVLFVAFAFDNIDMYLEKYKETAKSIEIKSITN